MKNYNEAINDISKDLHRMLGVSGEEFDKGFVIGIAAALSDIYEVSLTKAKKELLEAIENDRK